MPFGDKVSLLYKKPHRPNLENRVPINEIHSESLGLEEQRLGVFEKIAGNADAPVQVLQILVNYIAAANNTLPIETKKRLKEIASTATATLKKKLESQVINSGADNTKITDMLHHIDEAMAKLSLDPV